jgi:hypothetical protein
MNCLHELFKVEKDVYIGARRYISELLNAASLNIICSMSSYTSAPTSQGSTDVVLGRA